MPMFIHRFLIILAAASACAMAQDSAPPPACQVLTPSDVSALIGGGKLVTLSRSPGVSACWVQHDLKIVTVMRVEGKTPEAALAHWSAKMRAEAGKEIGHLGVKAYVARSTNAATIAIVLNRDYIAVKLTGDKAKVDDLAARLDTVMKAVAGRR